MIDRIDLECNTFSSTVATIPGFYESFAQLSFGIRKPSILTILNLKKLVLSLIQIFTGVFMSQIEFQTTPRFKIHPH